MPNLKKSSKKILLLATSVFLALALIFLVWFLFYAYSGDDYPSYNTITYGGQTYKTVKIGEQVWFAENLNYNAESSICYGDDPDFCAEYGRLYDWETAMAVCPDGWHLPSNADWDKLFRFVDGDTDTESPYRSPMAGEYLKADKGWGGYIKGKKSEPPGPHIRATYVYGYENTNGTNNYGFSALPGGEGYLGAGYHGFMFGERAGFWWSASEFNGEDAYYYGMASGTAHSHWDKHNKVFRFLSVRCVKD